jgi:chloramphenicol-sensitive protein RarD
MAAKNEDSLRGFGFALAAYLLWGFLPIYMKALSHISPTEVVAHRALWSLPIAGAVLLIQRRTGDLRAALNSWQTLKMACLTTALISTNWGIYVWAITSGHTLDAALGYYINPLFSVFLGAVLLKERLQPAQMAAIALAVLAVSVLTWEAGRLPIVSLALMLTWGFYAYLRKTLPIGPNQGFFLEVMLMALPAIGYILYLTASGESHFLAGSTYDNWLLFGCGIVTSAPLMIYANGAKLLKLSTIGIMQYIAPSLIFLTAVFVFNEPFGQARMIAFPLIWLALIIYTASMFRQAKRAGR